MICEWTSGSLHAIFLITISHGLIWPLYFLFDSSYLPPNDTCMDKRLFTAILAPDERAKHAYYCQRHQDEVTPTAIGWLIDWMTSWLSEWLILAVLEQSLVALRAYHREDCHVCNVLFHMMFFT